MKNIKIALSILITACILLAGMIWYLWPTHMLETATPAEAATKDEQVPAAVLEQRRADNNVGATVTDRITAPDEAVMRENNADLREFQRQYDAYIASLQTAPGKQIGTFSTSLAGHSAEGRVKNIQLANQKLSGKILMPGETLSFNEMTGDSNDPNSGWQLATVIVGQKFEQGYGGGICQVSSTLYNSVLRAGLEVRERYTHSLPVGYVQPGQDATVSYPELDFRFRNNQDAPVRIVAQIVEGQVVCTLHLLPKAEL